MHLSKKTVVEFQRLLNEIWTVLHQNPSLNRIENANTQNVKGKNQRLPSKRKNRTQYSLQAMNPPFWNPRDAIGVARVTHPQAVQSECRDARMNVLIGYVMKPSVWWEFDQRIHLRSRSNTCNRKSREIRSCSGLGWGFRIRDNRTTLSRLMLL